MPVSKKLAKRFVDRFGVGIPIEYEPLTAPPCPVCHTEPAGLERLITQKHETKIGYKCRTCGYAFTVTAV